MGSIRHEDAFMTAGVLVADVEMTAEEVVGGPSLTESRPEG